MFVVFRAINSSHTLRLRHCCRRRQQAQCLSLLTQPPPATAQPGKSGEIRTPTPPHRHQPSLLSTGLVGLLSGTLIQVRGGSLSGAPALGQARAAFCTLSRRACLHQEAVATSSRFMLTDVPSSCLSCRVTLEAWDPALLPASFLLFLPPFSPPPLPLPVSALSTLCVWPAFTLSSSTSSPLPSAPSSLSHPSLPHLALLSATRGPVQLCPLRFLGLLPSRRVSPALAQCEQLRSSAQLRTPSAL